MVGQNTPFHIKTPLLESIEMGQSLGADKRVFLKMESLQPSGSFKIRGIGKWCQAAAAEGKGHFISSSGGNAGLAVAYAGFRLGLPVTVIVPQGASQATISKLKSLKAKVETVGEAWDDAHAEALERQKKDEKSVLIHPFDHPMLWKGHSSLVDEVLADGLVPDLIVLSVGGGGLMCGVLEGLHRHGHKDIPILACETDGAKSFHESLQAGKVKTLDRITSIAKTLGAKTISSEAFSWSQIHSIKTWQGSDRMAVEACQKFLNQSRIMVEPACGISLAAIYQKAKLLKDYKNILVVVCGGSGVSTEELNYWAKTLPQK